MGLDSERTQTAHMFDMTGPQSPSYDYKRVAFAWAIDIPVIDREEVFNRRDERVGRLLMKYRKAPQDPGSKFGVGASERRRESLVPGWMAYRV